MSCTMVSGGMWDVEEGVPLFVIAGDFEEVIFEVVDELALLAGRESVDCGRCRAIAVRVVVACSDR